MSGAARRELEAAVEADARVRLEVPVDQVRILWAEIGPERLTLEMFGQLRDVPYERIRPMARVTPPIAGEYVIGEGPDGLLARASFSAAWEGVPRSDREERHLVADLIRLRERVAEMEAALDGPGGLRGGTRGVPGPAARPARPDEEPDQGGPMTVATATQPSPPSPATATTATPTRARPTRASRASCGSSTSPTPSWPGPAATPPRPPSRSSTISPVSGTPSDRRASSRR